MEELDIRPLTDEEVEAMGITPATEADLADMEELTADFFAFEAAAKGPKDKK